MTSNPDTNYLLSFLRRRFLLLGAAVFLAAVAASVAAGKFGGQTWACTATLLYNRSSFGEPHYRQPEAQSIVSLFKSRTVLETLARDFKLPPVLIVLANSIQAEIIYGSNTIQVTLRGDDPQRTRAMLDRLIQLVIGQAAQLRRDATAQIIADRSKNLAEAKATLEQAYRDLDQFHAAHHIVTDVEDDLARIRDDIAAVERASEIERPTAVNTQDELQRRRNAIQETLTSQRDAIAREAALTLKRNEYDRAARLHEKRYISDAEFRRIETEYQALQAQNADALRDMQTRLSQVDRTINDKLQRNIDGAAPAADDNPRAAAESARIQTFLQQRRAEAERLSVLRGREAELKQAVVTAQAEIQRLSGTLTLFQEFQRATFDDLTIVQPAAPALEPATSNKKKVFAGTFLAILGLLVMPLLLWDAIRGPVKADASDIADRSSITQAIAPVANASVQGTKRREVIRTLALRVQQLSTTHAPVVVLSRLDDSTPPVDVACDVAECLHRRGEKVLVVDFSGHASAAVELAMRATLHTSVVDEWTRTSPSLARSESTTKQVAGGTAVAEVNTTEAGFTEWLLDDDMELDQIIRRGSAFDVLTYGQADLLEEAFADRRMTALLDDLRKRYGNILALGPDVTRRVDLELLAARVDALAFVHASGRSSLPSGEQVWADLVALKAPLLGRFEV